MLNVNNFKAATFFNKSGQGVEITRLNVSTPWAINISISHVYSLSYATMRTFPSISLTPHIASVDNSGK